MKLFVCLLTILHLAVGLAADDILDMPMPITFVLKRTNTALETETLRVSDPRDSTYGQHLSNADLRRLAADPSAQVALEMWLKPLLQAPSSITWGVAGDVAFVKSNVAEVQAMFGVRVELVNATKVYPRRMLRALGPLTMPESVAPHIQAVFGTYKAVLKTQTRSSNLRGSALEQTDSGRSLSTSGRHLQGLAHCSMYSSNRTGCFNVTPSIIARLYGANTSIEVNAALSTRQAVVGLEPSLLPERVPYENVSLSHFLEEFVPGAPRGSDEISGFYPDGPYLPFGDGKIGDEVVGEIMMDTEYLMGLAPGVPTDLWMYSVSRPEWCHSMILMVESVLSKSQLPQVVSISFGMQGNLSNAEFWPGEPMFGPGFDCGRDKQEAVDNAFMKLAARGVSVLVASGDSGAGNSPWSTGPTLFPSWPASSSWVTAVGATRVVNATTGAQAASNTFPSGGGFSWDLPAPKWQIEAIDGYFARYGNASWFPPAEVSGSCVPSLNPPPQASCRVYSPKGRGTPDVAMIGQGVKTIHGGKHHVQGGTSASTPVFAALVSQLNAARMSKGCPSLGFLNPLFYQNPDAFTDITEGNNRLENQYMGWESEAGWDPVTGLGTPKFKSLWRLATDCRPTTTTTTTATSFATSRVDWSITSLFSLMILVAVFQ